MTTGSDSLLGRSVGNYVVTGFLGEGGMGQVYLAEHPQIRRRVAIKVLTSQYSEYPQAAERFLGEARAVARIEHANVIDIYDFGSLPDGRLYYVMEVLKGRDLRRVMVDKGKMSAREVWPYLEQIAAGLQAAHDHEVVHRDLKPENIFVLDRQPLALKILDFGIAKLIETKQGGGLTSPGMVMGTPLFIAPEQAAGQPERISPRTDLYSLGVVLYWMLAGRPPFLEDAVGVLVAKHVLSAPPPLTSLEPSVAPAIARLVDQCLEKDPLARPASASALAAAWAEVLATREQERGTPPLAETAPASAATERPPPTLPATAPPPATRTTLRSSVGELAAPTRMAIPTSRKRLALVASGGVILVTASALFIWGLRSPAPPATRAGAPGTSARAPADGAQDIKAVQPASEPASQPRIRAGGATTADRKQPRKPKPPASAPATARAKKLKPAQPPAPEPKPETTPVQKKTHQDPVDARSKPQPAKAVKKTKKGWVIDPVIP